MIFINAVRLVGGNGHEHIASVRWKNPSSGQMGENTRAAMVEWIRDKKGDARVSDGRDSVKVGVVNSSPPYLRTHADGKWTNNLLSLPRF